GRTMRLPWATCSGAAMLVSYLNEVTVHTWDLAMATGQRPAWDPEVVSLAWIGPDQLVRTRHMSPNHPGDLLRLAEPPAPPLVGPPAPGALVEPQDEPGWAFAAARDLRQPVYSRPFEGSGDLAVFQIHVPLIDRSAFAGTLVAEYSIESLLRYFVPPEVTRRHAISLVDGNDRVLASSVSREPDAGARRNAFVQDVPLAPSGNGLVVRGQGWRTSIGLIGNTLFWMVVALSALTVWMLLGTWRHVRRRSQMQSALISETNFRRAMENSMLTGMRAMDLEARITYVNPAFCAMTGFAESELIGRQPPFPYWSLDRMEENNRLLQQELQGRSPAGGIEIKIMRKDGTMFDSRMYVSPLIDSKGHQTGWMTSMTNITEAKRIR
ncbi:MAG: PAS domain S-box protein, partial [Pseudomonadota bacterium]